MLSKTSFNLLQVNFRRLASQTDCINNKPRRDSNTQLSDLESAVLPMRHQVMTEALLGCCVLQDRLCLKQLYFRMLVSQTDCLETSFHDSEVTRTRNLLIWKQTRYHFAAKFRQRLDPKNFIRLLSGQRPFMSKADVLQKACESS